MPVPAYRFASPIAGDCAGGVIPYLGRVSNEPFHKAPQEFDLPAFGRGVPRDGALVNGPSFGPADSDPTLGINVGALAEQRRRRFALSGRRWIGVDRAKAPDPGTSDATKYGSFLHLFSDLDALGAGWFREGQHGDLLWRHIFGGQQIPKPADILTALTKDHFAAFADFNQRLARAVKANVRMLPMVFQAGSGTGVNSWDSEDTDVLCDPSSCGRCPVPEPAPDPDAAACAAMAVTYLDVTEGRPDRQQDVLIPAMWGWDEWYWDYSDWPGGGAAAEELTYQKFALNIYNPSTSTGFMRLAASRKAMGVAAFGEAVGMLLADWEATLRREGLDLLDYVPFLEFGAEWDASWAAGSDDSASDREYARFVGVLAVSIQTHWPRARFKASEIASKSLVSHLDEATLWLGDALSVGLPEEARVYNLCNALRGVLSEPVPVWAEVLLALEVAAISPTLSLLDLLRLLWSSPTMLHFLVYAQLQFGGLALDVVLADLVAAGGLTVAEADSIAANHDVLYLLWAQQDSGTTFPPTSGEVRAGDLIHCVGLHWFLWTDSQYRNETYLEHEVLAKFQSNILDPCRTALGGDLAWAAGNVGFPSEPGTGEDANANATQTYQASLLARLLLTGVGLGADHLLWYSHMADLEYGEFFSNMGLRYDQGNDSFVAATDAFPKASWFAFQRLVRLLSATSKVEVVVNGEGSDPNGVVLLRLTAASAGYDPTALRGEGAGTTTYTHAFVPWVDVFKATSSDDEADAASEQLLNTSVSWARFTLALRSSCKTGRHGPFSRLALAPAETSASGSLTLPGPYDTIAERGGSSGYAASAAEPVWGDEDDTVLTGFGHTTQGVSQDANTVEVCVYPADGKSNAGLVAYFTNSRKAELADHG